LSNIRKIKLEIYIYRNQLSSN